MKNWSKLSLKALVLVTFAAGALPAQAQKATVGIKSFRAYAKSLEMVTGVNASRSPSIAKYYTENMTGLPRDGVVTELSGPTIMKCAALSGLFCKEMTMQPEILKTVPGAEDLMPAKDQGPSQVKMSTEKRKLLITSLANRFLDRNPTQQETKDLMEYAQTLAADVSLTGDVVNSKIFISICTSYGANLEFINDIFSN